SRRAVCRPCAHAAESVSPSAATTPRQRRPAHMPAVVCNRDAPRIVEPLDFDLRVIGTAGQGDGLQRTDAHLTIDQRTGDADALSDMAGEVDALHRIAHFDRGRTLLEEARLPAP